MPGTHFARLLLIVLQLLAGASPGAWAADPLRGATLFSTAPAPGLLGCIDCHSDNPHLNNFGNIWVGRNAEALIRRAVASNTGGMGYFNAWYGADDFADIAAYLGNVPARLEFPLTAPGRRSAPQPVRVLASTKQGIDALQLAVEGDFVIAGSDCGTSVARFGSCTVDLAFEPMASGLRSGSLWITHAGTPTPIRVALEGAGSERPPAVARVEPARLDFAPLAVGLLGSQRSARLVNDSDQPLDLATVAVEGADFQHVGGSCVAGTRLSPRAACTVALRFAPVTVAPAQGMLRFVHDGVNGASEVALVAQGLAPAPQLRAEPPALDLGWLPPGSQGPWQRIRLHAQGSLAVVLDTIEVSAAAFVVDRLSCTAGRVLAAGESCDLAVSLRAGPEPLLGGELRIAASGLRIPLSARVASQGPPAPGSDAPKDDAMPDLWVDHAELAFAPHRPGAVAHAMDLALWNRGTAALAWRAAVTGTMEGDFAVDGDCAATLQPQQRCTLRLAFTARATGWREATLVLGTDTAAPPVTVHLRGRGLPAARAGWAADPPRQDFPAQPPGTAALRRVWLQNLGTEPLPPPLPRFEGPFRAAPGRPGCEAAVAPGGRCAFDIEFAPLAEGPATGQLLLASPGVPPLQMPDQPWFGRLRADAVVLQRPCGRRLQPGPGQWLPARPGLAGGRRLHVAAALSAHRPGSATGASGAGWRARSRRLVAAGPGLCPGEGRGAGLARRSGLRHRTGHRRRHPAPAAAQRRCGRALRGGAARRPGGVRLHERR